MSTDMGPAQNWGEVRAWSKCRVPGRHEREQRLQQLVQQLSHILGEDTIPAPGPAPAELCFHDNVTAATAADSPTFAGSTVTRSASNDPPPPAAPMQRLAWPPPRGLQRLAPCCCRWPHCWGRTSRGFRTSTALQVLRHQTPEKQQPRQQQNQQQEQEQQRRCFRAWGRQRLQNQKHQRARQGGSCWRTIQKSFRADDSLGMALSCSVPPLLRGREMRPSPWAAVDVAPQPPATHRGPSRWRRRGHRWQQRFGAV